MTDGDLMRMSSHTALRSVDRIFVHCEVYFICESKFEFFDIAGFPSVTGAIDCTHMAAISPGGSEAEEFRNRKRKGYFSVNVQAVCDADRIITNIVVRWPGSIHDSSNVLM